MTGGNRGLWTLRVPEAAKHYPCAKT